ncbi:hypothetical protein XENOCAPTIV_007766, partial [Xenoophorus captivus]
VRHISPTRWVSTDAEAYFMGVGVTMEMTAPVLVKVPEETKLWEPAVYMLSFLLPAANQDKPPAPTNDKVLLLADIFLVLAAQLYFTEMPEIDMYVRSYGGWMLSVNSRLYSHLLTKELERVHASYNHSFHYGVGYDSPLKLLNRHNEVWYVAEGEPVCTDPQEPTPAHTSRPTPTHLPADSPSEMLSDSAYLTPSNLSTNTTFNSSSLLSSDPSAVLPSETPAHNLSDLHTEATFSQPPSSVLISQDPTTTNTSGPTSVNPSLELEHDAGVWNITTSSSVDTQADPTTEVQDDVH